METQAQLTSGQPVCDLRSSDCNCNCLNPETAVVLVFFGKKQREQVRGKSDFLIVWIYVVVQSNNTAARLTQDAIFAFFTSH